MQGAKVHTFDAAASPAEKASQAKQGAAATPLVDITALPSLQGPELKKFRDDGGAEVPTDVPSEKADETGADLSEAEALSIARSEGRVDDNGVLSPPGAMPTTGKVRESKFSRGALLVGIHD